jgi:DMSO/TMAO reductase YedYZ molybdopterin-dependent catalytic subunit
VNFYYAPNKDPNPVLNATDVIKIKVNTTAQPPASGWTLSLSGARDATVTQTLFEQGLACSSSGHMVNWTDDDGYEWSGVPLWLLVGMIDDSPDIGPDHFNFNDSIAAQGYSVKIVSGDGWDTTLSSSDIARNNSYIIASNLNRSALPVTLASGKRSWPLQLKGAAVFGGQQVGNITSIELSGLPEPSTGWKLTLQGDVTDVITQSYFEEAIASHHNITWTDSSNTVWEGMALWDLVGAVDDIETTSHFTFNDTRAATNYTVRVSAADGFNATFNSSVVAHNDGYIVAYKKNGTLLSDTNAPLKLVGPSTTSGKERVGNISFIRLEGLPDQFPDGDWQLNLNGTISDMIPQPEFEYWAAHHSVTYTDANDCVWTGIPLWRLMGWVDDRIPHGSNGFNDAAATAGYKVIVKGGDGYAKEFTSQQIGKNDSFIVANTLNGSALPTDGSHPLYPLRLVGAGVAGGNRVGNIVEIQLTDFATPVEIPTLHIVKYGSDGTTVINETTIDYTSMESNLDVIGDGTTVYKFEGLTMNASNLWDPEETYPGGFKVSNAVKGSRVRDLVELVGGMGSGTTVTFVASDGFETTLPYSSIYTNPAVQGRQGDAIIAWWADGNYVPTYGDGMRLFFTPEGDHVYGAWDMHETLPEAYWRYNYQDNVMYPSAGGLSAKYITTIKIYSIPESEWTLELDGRDIGGINYTVSKPYFEEALACTMGAEHSATYTDSKGRVWEGMPLWFLAGFVDDADQHSANSFNNSLASAGYMIMINSTDGSSTVVDSRLMMRNNNYILANSLNGTHILDSDNNWPLRLTGANVSGSSAIRNVSSITLLRADQPAGIGVFRDGFWILDGNGNYAWDGTGSGNDIVAGFGMTGDKPVVGNWNTATTGDKIGVFRDGTWLIDYNGDYAWDASDITSSLGQAGDTPVVGDWNGSGSKKIGVFRDGFWILDGNGNYAWDGTGTGKDIVAGFGTTGDIPVAADWQGTGQDKIGVFRDGFWILDGNGNYAWDGTGTGNDIVAGFGMAGDIPVVKDWNGDGIPEIAVFRASTGEWYIDHNGNYAWDGTGSGQDVVASLGQSGDVAVAGDWEGTGTDKLGVFRDGFWILDGNGNYVWDGTPSDIVIGFGTGGDVPVTGKWG